MADTQHIGKVISVSGPAVDVQFEEAHMPPIYQALRIVSEGFDVPTPMDVVVEVEQHIGEGRVRCIAMVATEGMVRGMKAIDTGAGITVPVGRATLGDYAHGGPTALLADDFAGLASGALAFWAVAIGGLPGVENTVFPSGRS